MKKREVEQLHFKLIDVFGMSHTGLFKTIILKRHFQWVQFFMIAEVILFFFLDPLLMQLRARDSGSQP